MQQLEAPLHTEKHRSALLERTTLPLAIVVMIVGIVTTFQGSGSGLILFLIGLAVAAYAWFTTPRRYELYSDRLIINYGRPRRTAILLSDISEVQSVKLPFGQGLVVRRRSRRGVLLYPRDAQSFLDKLQGALRSNVPPSQV